jgi:hypothetical protein
MNPLLLPTVTSFVPGLPTEATFRVSIHCWENPEISRYTQNLKKASDGVVFEARLFIDGRIAGFVNLTPPYILANLLFSAPNGSIKMDHGLRSLNSALVCAYFS